MATRYIYLSEELNEKLSKEDNASGLIQALLNTHYGFVEKKNKEHVMRALEEVNNKKKVFENLLVEFSEKEIAEERIKREAEEQRKNKIKNYQDSDEYWEKTANILITTYESFEAPKERFSEMIDALRHKEVKNLGEWMLVNKYKKKEVLQ